MTGLIVIGVAVVAALVLGTYRLLTDGHFRGTRAIPADRAQPEQQEETPAGLLSAAVPAVRLGERATLLQFSSAFCAPCRATRRTLSEVAALVPGVEHVEVDAEQHLDLVRRLGILRTPTTLVLDRDGREVTRAAGAPRKEQVLGALAQTRDGV